MTRVRLKEFKRAVRKVLQDTDIEPKEAENIAEEVMNLFGYDKTITDNLISSNERNLFYLLEDHDILATEEETAYLPSGKRWRIHYWKIKEKKIRDILAEEEEKEEEEKDIYEELSDNVWKREKEEGDSKG